MRRRRSSMRMRIVAVSSGIVPLITGVIINVHAAQNAAPPATAGGAPGQPAAQGGGRGGGRGGPGAAVYTEKCASCHGADAQTAGTAPKLFDQRWLDTSTD